MIILDLRHKTLLDAREQLKCFTFACVTVKQVLRANGCFHSDWLIWRHL